MDFKDLGLSQDLIDAVRAITEASCSAKKMEKEELHPNQVKLDKNKNGKLDADDFKRLRKEEETDESYVSNAQRKAVWASKNEKGVKEAKDGWSQNDSLAKPVTSSQAMANHSQYFTKVTKLDSDGNPKKPEKLRKEELEEAAAGIVNSGRAQHDLDGEDEKKEHADYMKKKHNVTTKYHTVKGKSGASYDDELSYHGSKENVKKAIKDHYGPSMGQEMKEFHPHLFKEQVEELDELSKGTLANYTQKAAHDVGNKMYSAAHNRGTAKEMDDADRTKLAQYYDNTANKQHSKALTRLQGIKTATKKLTKEQVEEIEMLAAKHGLGE